jgi:hypothetical protein
MLAVPYLLCGFEYLIVLCHLVFIFSGIYHFVPSEVPSLKLIALFEKLSLELFFFGTAWLMSLSCNDSAFLLLLYHLFVKVSSCGTQTEQPEGVLYQLALDLVVKGRIRTEGGTVVDLKKHWLAVSIQHYVKTEDLKA